MHLDVRRCRPLLGTFVEIAVPAGFEGAVVCAFAAVAEVHAAMSFHDEGSDLARLRRAPIGEWVAISRSTVEVLRTAVELHEASGGLFDPTVGAALVRDGLLPIPPSWTAEIPAGGMADLGLAEGAARLLRPLLLDLGGIAKGFAVDQAVAALVAAGVPSGLVNAGGDLRVLGDEPRMIAVRDATGQVVEDLALAGGALATSAFSGPGPAPHRQPDGAPLPRGLIATVAAPSCLLADAMTKVALLDEVVATGILKTRGGTIVHVARERATPQALAA